MSSNYRMRMVEQGDGCSVGKALGGIYLSSHTQQLPKSLKILKYN